MKTNIKRGGDYKINLKQAHIASRYFIDRNSWIKILKKDYRLVY